jgi:gliding motility-associated-like protein
MGGIEKYNIYRIINDEPDTVFLGSVTPDKNEYTDVAKEKLEGIGKFCYMIQAVEGLGDTLGYKAISNSNWKCINQESTVYIPNAFNPADIFNPTFKPIITFADPANYEFEVYNRWGQRVFNTNDIAAYWDGKVSNDLLPADLYAYRVAFKTSSGEIIKRSGTVRLIR